MAYKGIAKSKTTKSSALKQREAREKAARNKYKPSKTKKQMSSTSAGRKSGRSKDRTVRLMPLKENLVAQPPETALTRKGMSIKGLLRNTPALMLHNAQDVRILKFKKSKTKSGLPAIVAECIHQDPWRPDRTKKKRNVYIIGLDSIDKPISKQRRVLVSCDCENFVFTWEYANAVHGCSKVLYGNGEPPIYTNPHLVPALCKHVTAVALKIVDRGL